MSIRKYELSLFLIGVFSQPFFYVFKYFNYFLYQAILIEDSLVENMTAFTYFCCALIVFLSNKMKLSFYWKVILGVFFLFIALEEISYGQRLLNFEISDFWLKNNIQAESNLHNMPFFHKYIVPLAYFAISCMVIVLMLNEKLNRKIRFLSFLSPYFLWVGIVLPIILLQKYVGLTIFWFVEPIDVESSELILSLGFLLFFLHSHFKNI